MNNFFIYLTEYYYYSKYLNNESFVYDNLWSKVSNKNFHSFKAALFCNENLNKKAILKINKR